MVDVDTFLTTLYVLIDECCKASLPAEASPGPQAALSRSEVLTLALFGQWQAFGSERGLYRYAQRHLRTACPSLPARTQLNRPRRPPPPALVLCVLPLVQLFAAPPCPYAALASSGIPSRDAKRRGLGWRPGLATSGWSHRLGWYEGFPLRLAVSPVGVLTGLGFGAASPKEQRLADTFFALRRFPQPQWCGAGAPAQGPYVVDQGCAGAAEPTAWAQPDGVRVLCPPKRNSPRPWSKRLRRWRAGIRQMVETVDDKLSHTFRLDRERPHALGGFQARLAAKIA